LPRTGSRCTGDLDAWILISSENAERVLARLEEYGFGGLGLDRSDFLADDSEIQLGYPPQQIDILTSIDGILFDDAWGRRLIVSIGGLDVPLISRSGLVTSKRAANRPQDVTDVARPTQSDGPQLSTCRFM
jgi:hypothetical protein